MLRALPHPRTALRRQTQLVTPRPTHPTLKSEAPEIMEILEEFALTNSYRAAGELAGCSHHTVEHWVTIRDLGLLPDGIAPLVRVKLIDGFMPKIEEWVERSNGKVRGDVVFDKLVGLGFAGSDRTTRRALAAGPSTRSPTSAPSSSSAQTDGRESIGGTATCRTQTTSNLASWGRSLRRQAPKRTRGRHFSSGGKHRAVHLAIRCVETHDHGPCRQFIGDLSSIPGHLWGGPRGLAGAIAGDERVAVCEWDDACRVDVRLRATRWR